LLTEDYEDDKTYEEAFEMRTDITKPDGSIDKRFLIPSEDILDLEQTSAGLLINVVNPHRDKNTKISKFNGKLTPCRLCGSTICSNCAL